MVNTTGQGGTWTGYVTAEGKTDADRRMMRELSELLKAMGHNEMKLYIEAIADVDGGYEWKIAMAEWVRDTYAKLLAKRRR